MSSIINITIDSAISTADEFILAAKVLCENGIYYISMYNAGYAIEFLLKALTCKYHGTTIYPSENKGYKTHNIEDLIDICNLRSCLLLKLTNSIVFQAYWSLATSWSPEMRYRFSGINNKNECDDFIKALTDSEEGIITWLKSLV